MPSLKNLVISISLLLLAIVTLSAFAGVPYIYSLCFLSAWVALGHLITLDDDMPGEWSNPESDKAIWHGSLFMLSVKFLVFFAIVILTLSFPGLAEFGR